jgi:hypothetical protein
MDPANETAILKDRVVENLGKLSKSEIQNVLKFSEFLLLEGDKKKNVRPSSLNPKNDPILQIIGIADVEPFAAEIDQELYGD